MLTSSQVASIDYPTHSDPWPIEFQLPTLWNAEFLCCFYKKHDPSSQSQSWPLHCLWLSLPHELLQHFLSLSVHLQWNFEWLSRLKDLNSCLHWSAHYNEQMLNIESVFNMTYQRVAYLDRIIWVAFAIPSNVSDVQHCLLYTDCWRDWRPGWRIVCDGRRPFKMIA